MSNAQQGSFLRQVAADMYHLAYRLTLPIKFVIFDFIYRSDSSLPPAKLRFRVTEQLSPQIYLETSRSTAGALTSLLAYFKIRIGDATQALDFGCGCGRTLRQLAGTGAQFTGVDIDAESVDWCKKNLNGMKFELSSELPPLPFPDQLFDLIYAVSVFTHLDFYHQQRWRDELFRILKPGGMLVFTTHAEHIARKAQTDSSNLIFRKSKKLKGLMPDWYQTTFQSAESVVASFSDVFERVEHVPKWFGDQDAYVAFKSKC